MTQLERKLLTDLRNNPFYANLIAQVEIDRGFAGYRNKTSKLRYEYLSDIEVILNVTSDIAHHND